jgi:hypothetical protein
MRTSALIAYHLAGRTLFPAEFCFQSSIMTEALALLMSPRGMRARLPT